MIKTINAKLGNMRKVARWVLYPQSADKPNIIIIQCDKRIAQVDMDTGEMILSSGKGGHNGFAHLSTFLGAEKMIASPELVTELKTLCATNVQGNGIGAVSICG